MIKPNIAVGVSGASGALYTQVLIKKLLAIHDQWHSLRVVFTSSAEFVWKEELSETPRFTDKIIIDDNSDFRSPLASGSGGIDKMIVCPCSMGMLGRIANGISNDLISRGADVMLKERRQLILVTRETPLSNIHIENMYKVSKSGGVIYPASPSFYSGQITMEDLVDNFVNRLLDFSGFNVGLDRWCQEVQSSIN
ncbi:MAG: UbiX family flavin prenyltransferase [Bacteroidales bacterium]